LALEFNDGRVGWISEAEAMASPHATSRDRLRGYFDVLRAHGVDTATVPIWETQNDESATIAGLEAILARPERPTALLCQSDRIALAALDWLRAKGIDVPGEVSVVGYDGV